MDTQIDQHAEQAAPRLEFAFQIRIDLGERVFFGPLARGAVQRVANSTQMPAQAKITTTGGSV